MEKIKLFHLLNQTNSFLIVNGVQTIVLIVAMALLQHAFTRAIRSSQIKWNIEQRNKWITHLRTMMVILSVVGVAYIWADIGATLLTVSALVFASVTATKELLICVSGAFLRFRSDSYDVGDRIEIHGVSGDVLDIGILATTVLETVADGGQEHTGRIVTFPNSWLVSHPLHNETVLGRINLYSIMIPLDKTEDWARAKTILERVAQEECKPFLPEAQAIARKIGRDRSIALPSVEPRVSLHLPAPDRIDLLVQVPTPSRLKGRVEQAILERFLKEYLPAHM